VTDAGPFLAPDAAQAAEALALPDNLARHAVAGDTWRPVDLGPYLAGTVVRPEPTVGLARTDGLRLFYRGKEHAVIGEWETGKSWLADAGAAAELAAGNHVVYVHFEEADPTDTIERLQALGVPDADIVERLQEALGMPDQLILKLFTFVGPGEPADPYAVAALLDPPPSLVVLDGINEAMSLHRYSPREEDAVALFRARLVKPCTAAGAAVLSLDHVVKDREKRDRSALGSIHKGNALTGSLIMLENVAPFGRGQRGCSHIYVGKDRPGHLRRHGQSGKTPGKTYMGSLIVDDTRISVPFLELYFTEPAEKDTSTESTTTRNNPDDDAVLSAVAALRAKGKEPNVRALRGTLKAGAGMGKDRVDDAIERLLGERLTESLGARRARVFDLVETPATVAGDQLPPGDT
jgi:AAA domain